MARIIQNTEFGEITPGFSPRAMSLATATAALEAADAGGSASERRNILLFGYWPPTDILNMLAEWKDGKNVDKYRVQSFSPNFTKNENATLAPPGWDKGYYDSGDGAKIPYWGTGGGDIQVDYLKTSDFFWKKVRETKPIAIMSFSRSGPQPDTITHVVPVRVGWWLEPYVWNLKQLLWEVSESDGSAQIFPGYYKVPTAIYPPLRGPTTGPASEPVLPAAWTPPRAGGGTGDVSPYGPDKEYPAMPKAGNPLDPTKNAVNNWPTSAQATRESNLPMVKIVTAIQDKIPDTSKVKADINSDQGILGHFVSHYMAYHACWYKDYSALNVKEAPCEMAGHTHVDFDILPADAKTAMEVQLAVLIAELKKPKA